jgi:hypothetical protein
LHATTPKAATSIGLQAFAGVRSEELLRLTWTDLDRRKGFIEITAGKAKTAQRRLIPIASNLAQWSMRRASRKGSGRISKPFLFEAMRASKTKVAWKTNGLRHSFISYRVALTKDVAAVALEAGNSPAMIYRHYRELATEAEADEWFGIVPAAGEAGNVGEAGVMSATQKRQKPKRVFFSDSGNWLRWCMRLAGQIEAGPPRAVLFLSRYAR